MKTLLKFILISFSLTLLLQNCNQKPKTEVEKVQVIYPQNVSKIIAKNIPKSMEFKGDFLDAQKWTDSLGENYLIVSRSKVLKGSTEFDENTQSVEMYAIQYVQKGNRIDKLWELTDFEKDCPFDLWMGTVGNGIWVYDLDSNGIAESILAYKKTCRSDVSPAQLKLIMHQGKTKMALRGSMLLTPLDATFNPNNFEPDLSKIPATKADDYMRLMGRYENANEFKNQPRVFLDSATALWKRLIQKDDFKQL